MRQLNAILELDGHFRGRDAARYSAAIGELKRSVIANFPLVYVDYDCNEQPTHIPDFGHDYRCRCENPQPHGVKRYFSLKLYVDGEPLFDDVAGDYEITNGRLIICGLVLPLYAPESNNRNQLRLIGTPSSKKRRLIETRSDGTPVFA